MRFTLSPFLLLSFPVFLHSNANENEDNADKGDDDDYDDDGDNDDNEDNNENGDDLIRVMKN